MHLQTYIRRDQGVVRAKESRKATQAHTDASARDKARNYVRWSWLCKMEHPDPADVIDVAGGAGHVLGYWRYMYGLDTGDKAAQIDFINEFEQELGDKIQVQQ